MSVKHYPYIGGSFDRIVFDGDGSVWVPESENAKLREDLEFERSENGWAREFLNRMGRKCGTKDCPSLVAYVTKLEAENAKLRELVSGLEHCAGGFVCDCCPLYDPSSTNHRRCESLKQELGIEVDE